MWASDTCLRNATPSLLKGTFHTFTPVTSYFILYCCCNAFRHLLCVDTFGENGYGYDTCDKFIRNQLKTRELPVAASFSCWKKNYRIKYCTIKKIDYVFKPAIVTRNRCLISFFLVHLPCSETLCSCDICSFKKLKEVESTLPPGSSMPYISSWSSSQFSRTSLPASAPLAPRTGYEPPYWHRPCYFGWRYVTRGEGKVLLVMTLF